MIDKFVFEVEGQGTNALAEVCAASLRDYNSMVQVMVETGSVQSKPDSFFGNFDAIILWRSSVNLQRGCQKHLRQPFCGFEDAFIHFQESKRRQRHSTRIVLSKFRECGWCGVVWDEENLHQLEATKSPKQKIIESKTPYYAPDDGIIFTLIFF